MKRAVLLRTNPVNPDPPVEKMAETLKEKGYHVEIVAWDRATAYEQREETLETTNHCEIKITRFGIPAVYGGGMKRNLKALFVFQKRLKAWLKKHREEYDVIHAFDFDTGWIAKKIAKKYDKKFVYHVLDFYADSHFSQKGILRGIIKKLEFSVINKADATIVCTEKRKEQIKGSCPRKLMVIHNTPKFDIHNIHSEIVVKPSKKWKIVYVGVFTKGRLLEELSQIVKENPDLLELHIGGYGEQEALIKKYAENSENIFYYGKLKYSDVLALEKQCDIMTAIYDPNIPNHKYAAPNKFYESLALNKPIIMAKDTGFDDFFDAHNIGCLIEYNKNSLEEGIKRLAERLKLRLNAEIGNDEIYRTYFSWEIMARRIEELYNAL